MADRLNGYTELFSPEKVATYRTDISVKLGSEFIQSSGRSRTVKVFQTKFFDSEGKYVGTKDVYPSGRTEFNFIGNDKKETQLVDYNNNGIFEEIHRYNYNKYGQKYALSDYDISETGEWYNDTYQNKIKEDISNSAKQVAKIAKKGSLISIILPFY